MWCVDNLSKTEQKLRKKDLKTLSLKCNHHKSRAPISPSLGSVKSQL